MLKPFNPYKVVKTWGSEIWIANESSFCGKILTFNPGKHGSLHYHVEKKEVFYALDWDFLIESNDPFTGEKHKIIIQKGQCLFIHPGISHRIISLSSKESRLIEVSTHHKDSDSFRVSEI